MFRKLTIAAGSGAAMFLIGALVPASAQDDPLPAGFAAEVLLKTGVTRDKEPVVYPGGAPEIISVVGTLDPGGRTARHEHPVPVVVYMLEGEIEVKSDGAEPMRYKAGEVFIETQNRKHQAFNVASGVSKLFVVFVAEAGEPTTIAEQ